MDHMLIKQVFPAFLSAALLMTLFIPGAWAERSAGWWRDAEKQAELEDYRVISTEELHDLYQTKNDFVIIDNRFEYELSSGKLPGARNVPFDLSESQRLSSEKRAQLLEALGEDKDRIVVTYCRDFR